MASNAQGVRLVQLRSKQNGVPGPLLRFDSDFLAKWRTETMGPGELASMWGAFTKVKTVLEEGQRLENFAWRLWHRESQLAHYCRSTIFGDDLSDPEASASLSSDEDEDRRSMGSIDAARTGSFLETTRTGSASSRETSPASDADGRPPLVKRPFLPLLPSGECSAMPEPALDCVGVANFPEPSHYRAASARSLPAPAPLGSGLLPPPRPHALTPVRLAGIFKTLLPLNFADEAKDRCRALASTVPVPAAASRNPPEAACSESPEARWSAPEAGMLSQMVASAEATPVGSPSKRNLAAPPRIVSIAPTPPSASPATSRPASPLTTRVIFSPIAEEASGASTPVAVGSVESTTSTAVDTMSPVDQLSRVSAAGPVAGPSRAAPLRPAFAKRGNTTGKSVRITPPQGKSTTSERRAGGPRAAGSAMRRAGSLNTLATSGRVSRNNSSMSMASAAKGKAKARAESRSNGRSGLGREPRSASSASLSTGIRSPIEGLPTPRLNLDTGKKLSPQPLRTVVGFTVGSSSEESEIAGSSAGADPNAVGPINTQPGAMAASPVVPATPNNSQASASATSATTMPSAASSLAYPAVPPPTPAGAGAYLPSTAGKMSETPPQAQTPNATASSKARAQFFTGIDTDEENSPRSRQLDRMPRTARYVDGKSHIEAPPVPPPPPPSAAPSGMPRPAPTTKAAYEPILDAQPQGRRPQDPASAAANFEPDNEDTDSDDWSSEEEEEDPLMRRAREHEEREKIEKARIEAEFRSTLFIPLERQVSYANVKRAGNISLLFHRNQSAVELRRAANASAATSASLNDKSKGKSRSLCTYPRPSSMLKSKSAVALPVLAQGEPPEMKAISPPALSQRSRTTASSTDSGGAGPSRLLSQRPPKGNHPPPGGAVRPAPHRAHSRLGAAPANAEYSDDSDDEDETSAQQPPIEHEQRLAAVAAMMEVQPIVGHPLSPRTTRRNMLAEEMSESVRRNLLWQRQTKTVQMGVFPSGRVALPTQGIKNLLDDDNPYYSKAYNETGW